jgi:hypothetical protein
VRVARLLAWDEADKQQVARFRLWLAVVPALAGLFAVAISYGPALALTHEVTEWLVR